MCQSHCNSLENIVHTYVNSHVMMEYMSMFFITLVFTLYVLMSPWKNSYQTEKATLHKEDQINQLRNLTSELGVWSSKIILHAAIAICNQNGTGRKFWNRMSGTLLQRNESKYSGTIFILTFRSQISH